MQTLADGELVVDHERRVIRESPVLVDRDRTCRRCDSRCGDLIVDAPADVLLPRLAAIRPPRVLLRTDVDAAKDIDESQLVENSAEPRAFVGEKAGVLLIAAPVLEIDRLMRDVPVAAQDHF